MANLNRDQITHLRGLLAALRPDWDTQGIHAAVTAVSSSSRRIHPEVVIIAATLAAGEPANTHPRVVKDFAGDHWDRARAAVATDADGRRYASRRDRMVIAEARQAREQADPLVHQAGIAAARRALRQRAMARSG